MAAKGTGRSSTRLETVRALIDKCRTGLVDGEATPKITIPEFIRLLSLEKELAADDDSIREIKVTWVESQKTAPVS